MMKKIYFILIFILLVFNMTLKAQHLSRADSAIYYLKQVKGLQSRDSVLLEKTVAVINNTDADSLPADRIDAELKKLISVIHRQNYLAIKTAVGFGLALSKDKDKSIIYTKNLIAELKNYSNESEKNLLLLALNQLKFPFRNTERINEGVEYYQRLANGFEQVNDPDPTSICYKVLAGFYRTIGLMDKAIYCELKSLNFLNQNKIDKGNYFLFSVYRYSGLIGLINRKALLGHYLIENEEPQKALPFLYEAKAIFELIKDSVAVGDGPYVYLQIIRAKILTGGDSVYYYFDLMRKTLLGKKAPDYFSQYYQTLGYYCYLQNRLDSAEYFILLSASLKNSNSLMFNSIFGYLTPGYYLALIKNRQHKYTEVIRLLKDESNELLKINLRKVALKELILLSSAFKTNRDFENSTATLEQYTTLQKQIIDDENRSRSMSFETEQQINLLNSEKQKQQHEIIRQKFMAYSIAAVLLLVCFIAFLLFRNNRQQKKVNAIIAVEKQRSDDLLLNILPNEVAEELKSTGSAKAKTFSMVSVMFTDFKDFTSVSEKVSAELLVDEIHYCFSAFDAILQKYKIEKIKTIGDSYMCASGLPVLNYTHAVDLVNAAFEIRDFMLARKNEKESRKEIPFELRIGIHTGPVVAGIVGVKKFQYDIWGDTVNLAARMESSGEAGKINISGSTYQLVKDQFACTYRGKIQAKNKGDIDMYFVEKAAIKHVSENYDREK
jgi:class 3 adenylate cyclase